MVHSTTTTTTRCDAERIRELERELREERESSATLQKKYAALLVSHDNKEVQIKYEREGMVDERARFVVERQHMVIAREENVVAQKENVVTKNELASLISIVYKQMTPPTSPTT
jgi:hypothetical protein